jgi:cobalt/nickel transport protein
MISNRKFIVMGVLVSALLAGGASFYASSSPDGLEKVAEEVGFIDTAKDSANADTSLADYGVKGVENERLSVGVAGLIGVVATGAVSGGLFLLLRRKKTTN